MNVFLSWSGSTSRTVAEILQENLQPVLQSARFWMSNNDIAPGGRWSTEIAQKLEDSNFGIICITNENLLSPWIYFEAGALSKQIDAGRVVPLLFDVDVKDLQGPLTQFQAITWKKENILEICSHINKCTGNIIDQNILNTGFNAAWHQIEFNISKIDTRKIVKKTRNFDDIMEELVSQVRGLDHKTDAAFSKIGASYTIDPEHVMLLGIGGKNDKDWTAVALAVSVQELAPWILQSVVSVINEKIKNKGNVPSECVEFLSQGIAAFETMIEFGMIKAPGNQKRTIKHLKEYVNFLWDIPF
ncbi:toll/interleukin-1 receptor domain-containing protein [Sediminicoccus sp. KRV36]|uniref:toll/interleukin-1 receptor domain-containing protein n=1 Tax=Sediminicoccus sp. KRV36 TaxID=3133721 RepID=UPI00200C2690|nr:toll/interleukin-1 receptor domain-containing protein [Sediminicoccus rosea]UPY36983.1 toll/interleukin-1 receptor domain-containing protein [Sediminicoccus rosea]